jgi:hypothetical protein
MACIEGMKHLIGHQCKSATLEPGRLRVVKMLSVGARSPS